MEIANSKADLLIAMVIANSNANSVEQIGNSNAEPKQFRE